MSVDPITLSIIGSALVGGLAVKALTPPKVPGQPKIGPTPEEQARATAEAMALRQRRGRASTILTGPSATPTPAVTHPVGNLLGL